MKIPAESRDLRGNSGRGLGAFLTLLFSRQMRLRSRRLIIIFSIFWLIGEPGAMGGDDLTQCSKDGWLPSSQRVGISLCAKSNNSCFETNNLKIILPPKVEHYVFSNESPGSFRQIGDEKSYTFYSKRISYGGKIAAEDVAAVSLFTFKSEGELDLYRKTQEKVCDLSPILSTTH